MKKIFIDSDIILDVVLQREPFFKSSQKVMAYIEKNKFQGFTSALILANCFYIISNIKNKELAENAISKIRSILTILPFTDKEIGESLNSGFKDFEDGVQYFVALNNGIDTIITRNISDYKEMHLNVFKPKEFLSLNWKLK